MKILVTGSAGFVGYHLTGALTARGDEVVGLDNINAYYDPSLKYARLEASGIFRKALVPGVLTVSAANPGYRFVTMDLQDREGLHRLFAAERFDAVCHLAAQAGVRYSLDNPAAYIESNIDGFLSILEGCRAGGIRHLVYASSSSVYGLNRSMPFSTADTVDHPVSLYAATKKANELMAHTYSYLYGIPSTGLRFFTVYGPWGRPDMSYYKFTRAILAGEAIDVYNNGDMERDFTYIDDIVQGLMRVLDHPPAPSPHWDGAHPDPATSLAPYRIYNIGNNRPVRLLDFISVLEEALGARARMNLMPMQPGDVQATCADVSDLERDLGWRPVTAVDRGLREFVAWYRRYHDVRP